MMKLRSTKFFLLLWVYLFLFFILNRAWVVWEVLSPPPKLSPPPEWTGWGGGYGYDGCGVYEYDGVAWPPDETPAGGGGYEYGGGALPPDEPSTEGGGYGYGGYPYGGGGGMDMLEEYYHSMNQWPEVDGIDRVDSEIGEDMMVEVEVVEREHNDVMLTRHWTGDGAERNQRAHREWEELVKSGCSECHTTTWGRM
jgi:hypothetical protein